MVVRTSGVELPPAPAARPPRSAFAGVWVATLLNFLPLGAVLPVLPRYIHGPLGSGDVAVGVVVGCFAAAAVIARLWAGRAADRRGRRPIVVAGALLGSVAGLVYLLPLGLAGLVVARLFSGAGEGMLFPAGAAWAVDLAPRERRGQIIGLFGLAIWTGLSAGPLIGEGLRAGLGYSAVWVFCLVSPLLGALVASRQQELHGARPPSGPVGQLLPRVAVRPGIALALANVGYAGLAAFVILLLASRGVEHGTLVFTAFAVAVVMARLAGGRLPDRIGGRRAAALSGCGEAAGLAVIALAHSLPAAICGALVMGVGFSLLFPSLALMVVSATDEDARGAALGAFTAFFDVGVGLGAPIAGAIAALLGYPAVFWVGAACALLGVGVGLAGRGRPA